MSGSHLHGPWFQYAGTRQEQLDKHREQFEPEFEEVKELELIAETIETREYVDNRRREVVQAAPKKYRLETVRRLVSR